MRRWGFAVAAALAAAGTAQAEVDRPRDVVRLGTLEKVTARVSHLDVAVGETRRFGTLAITVEACFEAPPTEPPDSAVFLQITDRLGAEVPAEVFSGWMFASSPALSALEHAVYDVWVVDCLSAQELAAATGEAAPDVRQEPAPPRRRPPE